jgi:hypothetical protein
MHSAESSIPPRELPTLVTPILKQRLSLLSGSHEGSWLLLLNWRKDLAVKLPETLEDVDLTQDYRGLDKITYRRMDPETMLARVHASAYDLLPTYLWCMDHENNSTLGSWKLHELRLLEDEDEQKDWSESLEEAEEDFKMKLAKERGGRQPERKTAMDLDPRSGTMGRQDSYQDDDSDSDSYWASYDMTPGQSGGRTPAKASPAPSFLRGGIPNRDPSFTRASTVNSKTAEDNYFDQYLDVQPALDPYDPSEAEAVPAQPLTQHGRTLVSAFVRDDERANHIQRLNQDHDAIDDDEIGSPLRQPRPDSSSTSSVHARASSSSVNKLHEKAESQAQAEQAEMAIKTHISTDIKSLYRLAKSAGISREEFSNIVNRELEVLPFMDME